MRCFIQLRMGVGRAEDRENAAAYRILALLACRHRYVPGHHVHFVIEHGGIRILLTGDGTGLSGNNIESLIEQRRLLHQPHHIEVDLEIAQPVGDRIERQRRADHRAHAAHALKQRHQEAHGADAMGNRLQGGRAAGVQHMLDRGGPVDARDVVDVERLDRATRIGAGAVIEQPDVVVVGTEEFHQIGFHRVDRERRSLDGESRRQDDRAAVAALVARQLDGEALIQWLKPNGDRCRCRCPQRAYWRPHAGLGRKVVHVRQHAAVGLEQHPAEEAGELGHVQHLDGRDRLRKMADDVGEDAVVGQFHRNRGALPHQVLHVELQDALRAQGPGSTAFAHADEQGGDVIPPMRAGTLMQHLEAMKVERRGAVIGAQKHHVVGHAPGFNMVRIHRQQVKASVRHGHRLAGQGRAGDRAGDPRRMVGSGGQLVQVVTVHAQPE